MSELELRELTQGQAEALRVAHDPEYNLLIWTGAIRSGKGVGTANAIIDLAIRNALQGIGNGEYILGGATSSSFMRNNEPYLIDIASQAGLRLVPRSRPTPHYDLSGMAKFHIFGGGNKRSYHALRGMTAHSAWIDETTLCDELFVTTVLERCSFDDSQVVLTHNADSPTHWLKADWIDADLEGSYILDSDFDENIYYSDERRGLLRGSSSPHLQLQESHSQHLGLRRGAHHSHPSRASDRR